MQVTMGLTSELLWTVSCGESDALYTSMAES